MTSNNPSAPASSTIRSKILVEPRFYPIEGPDDAIYRNRVITRNYYYGAEALTQSLNLSKHKTAFQANWLHFGIWGSMRAGESIDGTDFQLAATFKDVVFEYLEQTLSWLPDKFRVPYMENIRRDKDLIKTLGQIIQASLAGGNQRVAEEIMGLTDRFLNTLGCDQSFDQENLERFMSTFQFRHKRNAPMGEIWNQLIKDIPILSKGRRHDFGQDALARAYEAYYHAKFESNPRLKAQMIHYGNLLIAIHEQFVLQTYISGAIGILDPASSIYRKTATILALDIGIPEPGFRGISKVGEGLKRHPLRAGFPSKNFSPDLVQYDWKPLFELAQVTGIDHASGHGATDWNDYKTRVYLISGMIRTLQDKPEIASYPFSGPHQFPKIVCQK